jgi:hypothetical protein
VICEGTQYPKTLVYVFFLSRFIQNRESTKKRKERKKQRRKLRGFHELQLHQNFTADVVYCIFLVLFGSIYMGLTLLCKDGAGTHQPHICNIIDRKMKMKA